MYTNDDSLFFKQSYLRCIEEITCLRNLLEEKESQLIQVIKSARELKVLDTLPIEKHTQDNQSE